MTKLRASLVCEMSLASSAREIKLGEYLKLGHGEWVTEMCIRDSDRIFEVVKDTLQGKKECALNDLDYLQKNLTNRVHTSSGYSSYRCV